MKARSHLLSAAVVSMLCTAAEAHISVGAPGPAVAGSTQELTFNVGHGCDGADTFRIEVRIPEGVTSVRPLNSEFGKAVVSKDAATNTITSVTWTKPSSADVLPADTHFYKLTLRARLPDQAFTTLFFPTIQHCRAADGTESTVEWIATTTDHNHGQNAGTEPAENPAPALFIVPARTPGWNKYTVDQHVHDMSVFKDAQIVWAGSEAYSPSTYILSLIEKEPNTRVLQAIHPGTEIWVKY
ncbi:YcnI family protein [Archangium violaceum]|uniref:YcnI family copper-binding membrane protein n=1 Tax=Archangium violaceum TaxID=83451 RepID=UPI00193BD65E|nr:YcnI family protein [Archangium violaceum]QRK04985.1 YcnI family protein [Archangium violaceum]